MIDKSFNMKEFFDGPLNNMFESFTKIFPEDLNIFYGAVIKGKVIIPETISETKDKSSLKLDILYSTDVQQSLEIQIVKLSIGIINES